MSVVSFKGVRVLDAGGARFFPFLSWDGLLKKEENSREGGRRGGFLFPGVWDFHVHGGGGFSLASYSLREVRGALRAQYLHGTSALLAALPLMGPEALEECLSCLEEVKGESRPGEAKLLGVYLEGPFINPEKVGGMNARGLAGWSVEGFLALLDRYPGLVRVVTIAPERPEAERIIPALVERGVVVAIGHTQAGEEEAMRAIALGARLATHLFNAMGSFHHRAPGAALTCLLDTRVVVEFIPEKGHLHPLVQQFIVKLRKGEGLLPVSDGTPLSAGGPEETVWMGVKVAKQGRAVVREDGRLFGSAITLLEGLLFLDREGIWALDESVPALLGSASALVGEKAPQVGPGYGGPLYYLSPEGELEVVA